MPDPSPCIAVAGPTAAGKTELALRLAKRIHGEIVNYDSVQVYRHFDIGSAKTPPSRRRGILHHMLDHVDPTQRYSAGDYARDARAVLERLRQRSCVPLLVGGTGLYLEALLQGLFPGPGRDLRLRQRLQQASDRRPQGHLWRILKRLDPTATAKIHPNDEPKLIRALEVTLLGGRPMTQQWRNSGQPLQGYRVLVLGLDPPREQLHARIDRRTHQMFDGGLIEEVEGLLQRGIPRSARPFAALGYAQCLRYLDGACTREEAVASTARETRRYAKRQMTWFRRRTSSVRWLDAFGDHAETVDWAAGECARWF